MKLVCSSLLISMAPHKRFIEEKSQKLEIRERLILDEKWS